METTLKTTQTYELSQSVKCHKDSVRTLDIHENTLITGSTDRSVNIFKFIENEYRLVSNLTHFTDYIFAVKINRFSEGYFIGSKDKQIYQLDSEGNVIKTLSGHTGPVCSLSQLDENTIVSGSWDGTARIWDLKESKEISKFEGHSHAVAVLGISHLDLLVTGSQNKTLNFYKISTSEQIKSIENAHKNIIRSISLVEGVGVITSSNDDLLKIWSFSGEELHVLTGHSSFVFSGIQIDGDTFASSSEDQSMKVWEKNTVKCSFLHPATVWGVALNHKTNDLITACADGFIRVFSTDSTRKAAEDVIEQFNSKSLLVYVQGYHVIPSEELSKVPFSETTKEYKGTTDGQLKVFRNKSNNPEIFKWSDETNTWQQEIEPTEKAYYEGDTHFEENEYDYVFSVDIQGNMSLIPFNNTDNPHAIAEKFCERENINKEKIPQIVEFLIHNSDHPKQKL